MRELRVIRLAALLCGAIASFNPETFCNTGDWSKVDFSEPETQLVLNEYVDIAMGEFFASNRTFDCPDFYETTVSAACIQEFAGTRYKIGYQVTCPLISYAFPLNLYTYVFLPLPGSNGMVEVSIPESMYAQAMPRGIRF